MSLNLRKKIMLKPTKPKSSVGNTKERTVTKKNDKTRCYIVTKLTFLISLLVMIYS